MNGVIRYVDSLSNGQSVEELQWAREDYLTAAASIPLMYTVNEIEEARQDMQRQSVRFSDETQNTLIVIGGNVDAMKAYINDSMIALDATLQDPNMTPWMSTARARLTVFNESSFERNATMQALAEQGVDITKAMEISGKINAKRAELEDVLRNNGHIPVDRVNGDIRILNQQFRDVIRSYRANLEIQMKAAMIAAIK